MSDVRTTVHQDGRALVIDRVQDVEPYLEMNKALRSQGQRSDYMRHVAQIPNVILERWLNEEHARGNVSMKYLDAEFNALVKRKLRDPEWKFLRVDK